jgi:hypothetical protein
MNKVIRILTFCCLTLVMQCMQSMHGMMRVASKDKVMTIKKQKNEKQGDEILITITDESTGKQYIFSTTKTTLTISQKITLTPKYPKLLGNRATTPDEFSNLSKEIEKLGATGNKIIINATSPDNLISFYNSVIGTIKTLRQNLSMPRELPEIPRKSVTASPAPQTKQQVSATPPSAEKSVAPAQEPTDIKQEEKLVRPTGEVVSTIEEKEPVILEESQQPLTSTETEESIPIPRPIQPIPIKEATLELTPIPLPSTKPAPPQQPESQPVGGAGVGASIGTLPMISPMLTGQYFKYQASGTSGEQDIAQKNVAMFKTTAQLAAMGAAAGAAVGGLHLLRQYLFQAPAGFAEQLKKLDGNSISDKIVEIGGKRYVLARAFDDLTQTGYGEGSGQTYDDNRHYEIYLMPDDPHLVGLFLAVIKMINESAGDLKDAIAFIALRPTPRVYNDYSLTSILWRTQQVLPRIVICLKNSKNKAFKTEAQKLINAINALISREFTLMKPRRYQPWGSQQLTPFISAGYCNLNYKKKNPKQFQAGWFSGDMAYPALPRQFLQLNPPLGVK